MTETIILNEQNFISFVDQETEKIVTELLSDGYDAKDIFHYWHSFKDCKFVKTYFEDFANQLQAMSCMFDKDDARDILTAYLYLNGLEYARECIKDYVGEYESVGDFAYEYTTERYDVPTFVIDCIDWDDLYAYQLKDYYVFFCGYIFVR